MSEDAIVQSAYNEQDQAAVDEFLKSLAKRGLAEPVYSRRGQPHRNQPCPCGSGKKFKVCHMRAMT